MYFASPADSAISFLRQSLETSHKNQRWGGEGKGDIAITNFTMSSQLHVPSDKLTDTLKFSHYNTKENLEMKTSEIPIMFSHLLNKC